MKFQEWLDFHKVSRNQAAKSIGLTPQTLYNVTKGKPITLKTAALIVAHTRGQVWYTDMLPWRVRTKLSPLLKDLCEQTPEPSSPKNKNKSKD